MGRPARVVGYFILVTLIGFALGFVAHTLAWSKNTTYTVGFSLALVLTLVATVWITRPRR